MIVSLANRLSSRHRVLLAVVRTAGPLRNELDDAVELIDLGGRLKWFFRFPVLIWKIRPRAVVTTLWDINLCTLAMRVLFPQETRVIVREAIMPHVELSGSRIRGLVLFLYRLLYGRADCVISLSQRMKSSIQQITKLPDAKIIVIKNGIHERRVDENGPVGARDYHAPYLIAVGRLAQQKGFDVLIQAFAQIKPQFPNHRLLILGEGHQRQALDALIRELGLQSCIELLGHVVNPLPLMAGAELFVLSSRYEGLPNVVIESLSVGTPVLATVENTSADEVILAGINGYLINKCKIGPMASALREILANIESFDRAAIASEARLRFSLDGMVRAYEQVLLETGKA